MSLNPVLKAVLPVAVSLADPSVHSMIEAVGASFSTLPDGGIANARWREKGAYHSVCRIGKDALKGFGSVINVAVTQAMMGGMGAMGGCDEDGCDDCDDEDDGDDESED